MQSISVCEYMAIDDIKPFKQWHILRYTDKKKTSLFNGLIAIRLDLADINIPTMVNANW